MEEQLLSVPDYAKKMGVTKTYIYQLVKSGKLKSEYKQCFVEHNGRKFPTGKPKLYVIYKG